MKKRCKRDNVNRALSRETTREEKAYAEEAASVFDIVLARTASMTWSTPFSTVRIETIRQER
jgi:hypothetical protein